MFDIGWSELMVIAVVAIVVIGPKDLPRVMRLVGQWSGKLKRMARDFQGQFNEALREAELDDVRKDVEAIGKNLKQEVAKTGAEIDKGMTIAAPPVAAAPAAETAPAAELPAPVAAVAEPVADLPPSPEPAGAVAGEAKP
jgi:sec-independent protein translocase protein TatB